MRAILAALFLLASAAAPAAAQAPEPVMPRGTPSIRLCSPFVPNAWRSMTIVLPSWTIADCVSFARSVGATHIQLGCIFDAPAPGGQRFSWGRRPLSLSTTPSAGILPVDNCGWRV